LNLLTAEANKGTPLREISLSLDRSNKALRDRLFSMGVKLPRDWTPEEDETLLRMRRNNAAYEQIALHVDRSASSVAARWHRIRPKDSFPSTRVPCEPWRFQPTSTETQEVARLRQEGHTWVQITALLFDSRSPQLIRSVFTRIFGRDSMLIRGTVLRLLPSDIQTIESLLEEGKKWREIASMKYPDFTGQHLRGAYVRKTGLRGKDVKAKIAMPSTDTRHIGNALQAGSTQKETATLKYPSLQHRRSYSQKTGLNMKSTRKRKF
jgi:hypothetical protein